MINIPGIAPKPQYLRAVIATKDDAGHWYLIPNELSDKFRKLMNKYYETEDDDIANQIDTEFGKFRTGGDVNNQQLYIEIPQ